jgi:hypothetical protein
LAQRQGLLTGRHLSDVQFNAVIILDWIDRMASAKKDTDRELLALKTALITRADDEWRPESLFKEWVQTPTSEESEDSSLDVENDQGKLGVDYSEVEFKGSEAIEEYHRLMREIGTLSNGSLSGAELRMTGGGDGGWV